MSLLSFRLTWPPMPCRSNNGWMVSAVKAVWAHLKSEEAREETILALETTLAAARQSAEAGLNAGAVFGRDVSPLGAHSPPTVVSVAPHLSAR